MGGLHEKIFDFMSDAQRQAFFHSHRIRLEYAQKEWIKGCIKGRRYIGWFIILSYLFSLMKNEDVDWLQYEIMF